MTDPMYALFDGDKQISKAHASKRVVLMEAYEKGCVIRWSTDFIGDSGGEAMLEGFSIKEIL